MTTGRIMRACAGRLAHARRLGGLLLLSMAGPLLATPASPLVGAPQLAAWRNPTDGMRFVWIPAGHLALESDPKSPFREVPVDGFWMGKTEVTVAQFRRFVRQTGYVTEAERAGHRWTWRNPGFPQGRGHPVVYLSPRDAQAYARWAGVDLPTEVEWLYACRAGTTGPYYWGTDLDPRHAWYRLNAEDGTRAVARKPPNPWGLYDMVGNAWEYCKVSSCAPDHQCYAQKGAAWTRCPSYESRWSGLVGDLVAQAVRPVLERCDRSPALPPYPWDDDRGFRCIIRPLATAAAE